MMSQNEQVLDRLQRGKSLTPLQALRYYDCMRLAARVGELREKGHDITTTIVQRGSKRFASYALEDKK